MLKLITDAPAARSILMASISDFGVPISVCIFHGQSSLCDVKISQSTVLRRCEIFQSRAYVCEHQQTKQQHGWCERSIFSCNQTPKIAFSSIRPIPVPYKSQYVTPTLAHTWQPRELWLSNAFFMKIVQLCVRRAAVVSRILFKDMKIHHRCTELHKASNVYFRFEAICCVFLF